MNYGPPRLQSNLSGQGGLRIKWEHGKQHGEEINHGKTWEKMEKHGEQMEHMIQIRLSVLNWPNLTKLSI